MSKINDWHLRKYRRLTKKIIALEPDYRELSDAELQHKMVAFRERLEKGASLDSLLVEAYATVREADDRVLGMRPYPNQVLGATVLNDRNVAELATGEGKTLVVTMPLYLNGLEGVGTYLVTANDYLASRDAKDMGRVYRWLGLTIGTVASGDNSISVAAKKAAYRCDIVYTTHSAIGFDYLIDNLASNNNDKNIVAFRYALIDEVDSVLLDLAQTPLVISGAPKVQSNLFTSADKVVKNLVESEDYIIDDDQKSVWFTEKGIASMSRYFGVKHLMDREGADLYRHLVLALRANTLLTKNRDYVVDDGKVVLLDIQDGREMNGMNLQAGMHQALEAKEGVKLSPQDRAMASITYQNLFHLFTKLAGMTGTAKTDRREFAEVYNLLVIEIPSHQPNIRIDKPDQLFVDTREKLYASIDVIKKAYAAKRPVLIETGSVSLSELYSRMLLENGIVHNLLNARSAAKEAQIVKEAGQPGAITVATSMAGRGTDIKLGPGVRAKGGLLVIGTERMANRRIDNQLRGRSGRQGDPGETMFYASLEDRGILENGSKKLKRQQEKLQEQTATGKRKFGQPITKRRIKHAVTAAQKTSSSGAYDGRMGSIQYDAVQRRQRNAMYRFRDQTMALSSEQLMVLAQQVITHDIDDLMEVPDLSLQQLSDYINNNIDYSFYKPDELAALVDDKKALRSFLLTTVQKRLDRQLNLLSKQQRDYFLRLTILHALDNAWIEQVDNLQQLRAIVSSRSSAQHDPVAEYQLEAVRSFDKMKAAFWRSAVQNMMLSKLIAQPNGSVNLEFP